MPGRGGGDNGHHCSGADQPTATETLGEVLSNGQRMSSSAAKTSDDGDRDSKNVGKKKKATTSPTLAPAYQHQHQDPQNFTYYHDYYSCSKSATLSLDTIANGAGRLSPLRTASPLLRIHKLPSKLSAMLCNPEFTSIISWMPHGRSWKVHNVHLFLGHVIPHFFEYSNYNSFIRLVNAWGFRRILKGPDRNSYYHELFLRGMPGLHGKMHRLTSTEKKAPVHPSCEPDFYGMISLPSETGASTTTNRQIVAGPPPPLVNAKIELLHEIRVAEAQRKRFQEENETATVDAQRRILASSLLGVRAHNPAFPLHPSLAFAGNPNSTFPFCESSPQNQLVGGTSSFLHQHPPSGAAGGSRGSLTGAFGSPALSDMALLERRQATISTARESMDSEVERLREQNRLLSLEIMRNNRSNLLPLPVYDQPNNNADSIAQQYETAMALLSQQSAQSLDISAGALFRQDGRGSSSYYDEDDATDPPLSSARYMY